MSYVHLVMVSAFVLFLHSEEVFGGSTCATNFTPSKLSKLSKIVERIETGSSLDHVYKGTIKSDKSIAEKNRVVTELLGTAFVPFSDALRIAVNETTEAHISNRIEELSFLETKIIDHKPYLEEGSFQSDGVTARGIKKVLSDATRGSVFGNDSPISEGLSLSREGSKVLLATTVYSWITDYTQRTFIGASMVAPASGKPFGETFGVARVATTNLLQHLAVQHLRGVSRATWNKNKELLSVETARGRDQSGSEHLKPLSTFIEGIQSLHHALSLLLSNIPSHVKANGPEMLRHLLNQDSPHGGLLAALTRRIPLGWTGPTGWGNGKLKEPLLIGENNQVHLPTSLINTMKSYKINQVRRTEVFGNYEGRRGICPFATMSARMKNDRESGDKRPSSDMQDLGELYLALFERVYPLIEENQPKINRELVGKAKSEYPDFSAFQ